MGINTFNTDLPNGLASAVYGMNNALEKRKSLGYSLLNPVVTDTKTFLDSVANWNTADAKRYLDSIDPNEITNRRNMGISNEDMYRSFLADKGFGRGVQLNENDKDLQTSYGNAFKSDAQQRVINFGKYMDENANKADILGLSLKEQAHNAGYDNLTSAELNNLDTLRTTTRNNYIKDVIMPKFINSTDTADNYFGNNYSGFNATDAEKNFIMGQRKPIISQRVYDLAVSKMREDEANDNLSAGTYTNNAEKQNEYYEKAIKALGLEGLLNVGDIARYDSSKDPNATIVNTGVRDFNRQQNFVNLKKELNNDESIQNYTKPIKDYNTVINRALDEGNISKEQATELKNSYAKEHTSAKFRESLLPKLKIIQEQIATRPDKNYNSQDINRIYGVYTDFLANLDPDADIGEAYKMFTNIIQPMSLGVEKAKELNAVTAQQWRDSIKSKLSTKLNSESVLLMLESVWDPKTSFSNDDEAKAYDNIINALSISKKDEKIEPILQKLKDPNNRDSYTQAIKAVIGKSYAKYRDNNKKGDVNKFFDTQAGKDTLLFLEAISQKDIYDDINKIRNLGIRSTDLGVRAQ